MVDGIKTLLIEEAKAYKGADVILTVLDGKESHQEEAHVITIAHVAKSGPCFITDHGDVPVDHVTACERIQKAA